MARKAQPLLLAVWPEEGPGARNASGCWVNLTHSQLKPSEPGLESLGAEPTRRSWSEEEASPGGPGGRAAGHGSISAQETHAGPPASRAVDRNRF
jgi:hypothetical protein